MAHRHLHHAQIHRRDKGKDDKAIQSAYPNLQPNGSVEGSKSEGITPNSSRVGSRRTSLFGHAGEGTDGGLAGSHQERRVVKEGEVDEERQKGVLRATELCNSLMNLNTLSNNTTRRLDNQYYSVLEKLSLLQSTLTSLKELATMTKQLNEEFKTESEEIVEEVETQLNDFEGFQDQQRKIESLEGRVNTGREKIKMLGGRVGVVRERVVGWERAEGEWQEKTRRRLRILWIIISICATVLVALVVFQYTPARTQGPGVMRGLNASSLAGGPPEMEKIRNKTWSLKRLTVDTLEGLRDHKENENETPDDDPRLKLFDEL